MPPVLGSSRPVIPSDIAVPEKGGRLGPRSAIAPATTARPVAAIVRTRGEGVWRIRQLAAAVATSSAAAGTTVTDPLVTIRRIRHPRGDRLKQLRAFCNVARLGSISQAADLLRSRQPAVSAQVRMLEEELGVALFERHGPRISLTRVGERLYERAMPLVMGMDRLPEMFAEGHHGAVADVLRIGAGQASAAHLLPEYLRRFRERYPETRIEVTAGTGRQRLDWLRAHDLDLVVVAMDTSPPDLEFHPVCESGPVLVTCGDHPLAGRRRVSIEEVAHYPFVGNASAQSARWAAETILRMYGIVPDVVVEVDGWDAVMSYVSVGAGISFVPDLCLGGHDGLWKIPFKDYLPARRYGALTRRDSFITRSSRRFLRILVSEPSTTWTGSPS